MLGVFGAIIVVTIMTVAGDAQALADALSNFDWWLIAPIFLLTLWNYALRFLKWDWFLHILGITTIPKTTSLRIFLSGFAMSVTPGKVGEFIKAVYVRRFSGHPVNRGSAIVTAERATDAGAMAVLSLIGVLHYAYGREFVALIIAGGLVLLFALQRPDLVERGITISSRIGPIGRVSHHLRAFFDASSDLLSPVTFSKAVVLSTLSWAGECVAFFLVLVGLGMQANVELLMVATFILAVSSLAGGISMLPGGLGVADASAAGMLLLLVNDDAMTKSVAVAATLIIRFATLWFGVLIGAVSLFFLERIEPPATFALNEPSGEAI